MAGKNEKGLAQVKNPVIEKLIAMHEHDDALNPSDVAGTIAALGVAKFPETVRRLAVRGMELVERGDIDFADFKATLDKIQGVAQSRLGKMAREGFAHVFEFDKSDSETNARLSAEVSASLNSLWPESS